jgi:hypothetical protein
MKHMVPSQSAMFHNFFKNQIYLFIYSFPIKYYYMLAF